jgi:bifunctional non-homologous end joining protein LigD
MASEAIEIGGVRLTSPDKVLYPEQGITKRALADYYLAVADVMLPHVAERPITLVRCPTGREKKCFYQRHAGSGVPDELGQVEVQGFEHGAYLYIRDAAGLVAMVQMGVLEVHPWGARIDRPERPDRVVFDLDPGEGLGFPDVVTAALDLRKILAAMGLQTFVKTTGGKGLHVVAPIERQHDWGSVKGFARAFAERLSAEQPTRFLSKISIEQRKGRIFIDYLRNDPTSTAVAPYSTRARPNAPVATPLAWDELTDSLDPKAFTLLSVPARLAGIGDPWRDMDALKQPLPKI